jgi:predicted transcriptional regulator YdeE
VIGIAGRTTNADEMSGNGIIPRHWKRFVSENVPASIGNRVGSDVIAVYTDYESDANGAYTFLIGVRVEDLEHVPAGLAGRLIPAGSYVVVTSEEGPLHNVVPQAWGFVWSEAFSEYKRSYVSDFEIYDQRAQDPSNGQVDIYVGVGPPSS